VIDSNLQPWLVRMHQHHVQLNTSRSKTTWQLLSLQNTSRTCQLHFRLTIT
jgi:hypothetical protein